MIRVYVIIALYVLIPVLIIECFKRWTWMQKIGTVVAAYAVGIIFALTGFVHFEVGTEAAPFSANCNRLLCQWRCLWLFR